ncbi:MAG: sigma-70 family RNA polymerase sigma factor [Phycisphaerae bacterium]|nr:sigma-70 family RNA polymerase sigma factor [Phycisphaerae bacterium]
MVSPYHHTAEGNGEAFEKLLAEHGPIVHRRIANEIPRRWRSILSADDVMQETYLDAFLDIDRFAPTGEGSFAAWLTALAKCNLVDTLRMLEADKRGKGRTRIEAVNREDSLVTLYELLSGTGTTPSRCAARNEAFTKLEWAIQQLPENYGRVVRMFHLEQRSMKEVARALQRSVGAVYAIKKRAFCYLRKLMGGSSGYFSAP